MSVRRAAPCKFTGLVVVLAVASAAGPASAWDAFQRCVEYDATAPGRGNTHLFIVNRAITLLERSTDPVARSAAAALRDPVCTADLREGLQHADVSDGWVDADHNGSHFFNADPNAACNTYVVVGTCVSGAFNAAVNAERMISQFVTGRSSVPPRGPIVGFRPIQRLEEFVAGGLPEQYGAHGDPRPCFSLGLALHFMTDVTMPFHAASFSGVSGPEMLHPIFESYVPRMQARHVALEWAPPPPATPSQLLAEASRDAGGFFGELMAAINASPGLGVLTATSAPGPYIGHNFRGNARVDQVTGRILRRAQTNTASYLHAVFRTNPTAIARVQATPRREITLADCPEIPMTTAGESFGTLASETALFIVGLVRGLWDETLGRLLNAVSDAIDAAVGWFSHRFERSVTCFEEHVKPAARAVSRSALDTATAMLRGFWQGLVERGYSRLTPARRAAVNESDVFPAYATLLDGLLTAAQQTGDSGRTKIGMFFDTSESIRNADALYWQFYWGGAGTDLPPLWPSIFTAASEAFRTYAGAAMPLEIARFAPSGDGSRGQGRPWLPAPLAPALANCLREASRFRITASAANLGAAVTASATATPNRLGCFQHFAAGSLYSYGGRAPVAVLRGLLEAWGAHGYERGALGFPFMAAAACAAPNDRDQRQVFQGGQLVWRAATSRAEFFLRPRTIGMYGDCRSDQQIITAKLDEAALRANLGPATGGLEQLSNFGGRFYLRRYRGGNAYTRVTEGESTFVGPDGALVLGARLAEYAQAYAVRTALLNAWAGPLRGTLRWEHGLGLPTTGELACTAPGGDKVQHFERGRIVWRAATSRAELYEEPFWWPNPQDVSPYGSELLELRRPRVVGDGLDCSPSPNQSVVDCAYVLRSQRVIGELWTALGSPTGAVAPTPTRPGCFQVYQRGNVYWRPGGVQPKKVVGSILAAFGAQRWEQGPLGLPLTEEQACAQPSRADRWQQFDGGRLVWRAATNRVERYPNPTSVGTAGDCRRPAGSVLNDALILTPILLLPGLPKR